MNWITLSIIALFSFSVMAILMAGQTKKGISVPFTLAVVVGLWIPFFGLMFYREGFNFAFSKETALILSCMGLLSIIANLFLFEAASEAPNPGFAFGIVNANPVFIAVAGYFFLGSEFQLIKLLGIAVSVIGVIIFTVSNSRGSNSGGEKWIIKSLIALAASSAIAIIITGQMHKGVSLPFIMLFSAAMSLPAYIFWAYKKGFSVEISKKDMQKSLAILFCAGIFSVIGNWAQYQSAAYSPNPGLSFALSNGKPILIAGLGKIFLSSELSLKQLIGILICIAGIAVIVLL